MLSHMQKKDVLIVRLEGELDQCSASGIRRELDQLLQNPSIRHLVLDMEKMPFMDSSDSVRYRPRITPMPHAVAALRLGVRHAHVAAGQARI